MKYNWDKLKIGYFGADSMSVVDFIEKETGKKPESNSHIAGKTKGWREEKEKLMAKAVEESKKKLKKEYTMPVEELLKTKMSILKSMQVKLQSAYEKDEKGNVVKVKMPARDLEILLRSIKIELQEPITISKGEMLHDLTQFKEDIREKINQDLKEINGLVQGENPDNTNKAESADSTAS